MKLKEMYPWVLQNFYKNPHDRYNRIIIKVENQKGWTGASMTRTP